jgi:hypothetical protein
MKVWSILAVVGAISATSLAAKGAGTDLACPVATRHSLGCASTSRGSVLAESQIEAERIKPYAARGENRFRRFFGISPVPYLFISGTGGRPAEVAKAVGRPASLTWPSAAQRADSSNIRRAVEASLAGSATPLEQKEAAVQKAISDAGLKTVEQEAAIDAFAVPHELAHIWLSKAYWPQAEAGSGRYASPAPDWLDEGAAQLMEASGPEHFSRDKFVAAVRGEDAMRKGMLAGLLEQDHPAQKLQKLMAGKPQSTGWTMEELKAMGIESVPTFYACTAGLTAFLLARSKNERILAEIARNYASGRSFSQWLEAMGPRYGLGRTVDELETLWLDWLKAQA